MKIYILYGSATGNAEQIAKDLAVEAKASKADDEEVICEKLDTFRRYQTDWSSPSENNKKHGLIVICSTTGNGDAPENASRFLRFIKRKTTSPTAFQNVCYGVLGLGDTNYDKFCLASEIIDSKLCEKGGTRVQRLMKADEAVGLESVVEPFLESILQNIRKGMEGVLTDLTRADKDKEENPISGEEEKKEDPSTQPSDKVTTSSEVKSISLPSTSTSPLYVMYASATGNAEFIAKDLASSYKGTYFRKSDIICAPLNSYKSKNGLSTWESEPPPGRKHGLLIICSTTGNGDVPDNGERFSRWLGRKSTPEGVLNNVAYSVLALGDTNYDQFCQAGITIDAKMQSRGGLRVTALAKADEATGLEDVVEPWKMTIFAQLENACRGGGNLNEETMNEETKDEYALVPPSVNTICTTSSSNPSLSVNSSATTSKPINTAMSSTNRSKPALPSVRRMDKANSISSEKSLRSKPTIEMKNSSISSCASITISSTKNNSSNTLRNSAASLTDSNNDGGRAGDIYSNGGGISAGVEMILRALYQREEEKKTDEKNSYSKTTSELIQTILAPMTTKIPGRKLAIPTTLRSCNIISSNDNGSTDIMTKETISNQQEWEHQTASSMSSSGIIYTHLNPFMSSITKARYLTKTDSYAAVEANRILSASLSDDNSASSLSQRGKLIDEMIKIYDKHFPIISTNGDNKKEADRNGKRVIELTLKLPDDFSLSYEPGDSLGLVVPNRHCDVEAFWSLLHENQKSDLPDLNSLHTTWLSMDKGKPITLEHLLTNILDLSSPFTNPNIVRRILQQAVSLLSKWGEDHKNIVPSTDESHQIMALEKLLFSENDNDSENSLLEKLIIRPRWTIIDLIRSFPILASRISFKQWIEKVLPTLAPRYYSVSSSPLVKSLELTIAFSVVDYNTMRYDFDGVALKENRVRKHGIATRYLEALASPWLAASTSDIISRQFSFSLPIFPKPTTEFRLPSSLSTPLILVGPGTGIAPFLGFLQHRRAQFLQRDIAMHNLEEGTWRGSFEINNKISSVSTENTALASKSPIVDVYFGCRYEDHDFLYQSELESFQEEGWIRHLHTAFSRSASKKKEYVQDKMLTHYRNSKNNDVDMIQLILERNASVYVCGDGNFMAKDVQAKIVSLISTQLGNDIDAAQDYLEKMKREQRFVMDIWS